MSVESARVATRAARRDESSAAIDRAGATKMPRISMDVGNNRQFSVGPSMRRGMKLLIYRPTDKGKKKYTNKSDR